MNKNYVIVGFIIIILLGGVFIFMQSKGASVQSSPPGNTLASTTPENAVTSPFDTVSPSGKVNRINVGALNYKFSMDEIRVKKGETVEIEFTNREGFHDFMIDAYNIKIGPLPEGQAQTAKFVADKVGTFEFYCSIPTHRQAGMKGKFIVE